jgi:hypothetical protein
MVIGGTCLVEVIKAVFWMVQLTSLLQENTPGYMLDDLNLISAGVIDFLCPTTSSLTLGHTQSPIK